MYPMTNSVKTLSPIWMLVVANMMPTGTVQMTGIATQTMKAHHGKWVSQTRMTTNDSASMTAPSVIYHLRVTSSVLWDFKLKIGSIAMMKSKIPIRRIFILLHKFHVYVIILISSKFPLSPNGSALVSTSIINKLVSQNFRFNSVRRFNFNRLTKLCEQ